MKRLTLIRHAKSSHDNPAMRDFDRPLNARGRRDAPAIGRHLDETHDFLPDLVLSSPATRAITTARMIAKETALDEWAIRQDERIYEAPVSSLAAVVRELSDHFQHVAIFGHNPGMEDFTNWLCGHPAVTGFRTGGVVFLELDLESWSGLHAGTAVLKDYLFPAMIGAGKESEPTDRR
ncbi:MAG: histidine phosphatase family protein [Verrucomicrobiota bacterium]